jgi:type IV pilus assembly protein PilA
MHWQKGFSLIELLIVVAIIGVVSSIAVPNFISSRRLAKEKAAIGNVRTLISAEGTFLASSAGGYSRYGTMADLIAQSLVSSSMSGGVVNGYQFDVTSPPLRRAPRRPRCAGSMPTNPG